MRGLGIHAAVMHAPPGDHRQAAADHGFLAINRTLFLVPMRLAIAAAAKMRCDLLDPFRIDARDAARPQPRRFHQLHRHHPLVALGNAEQPEPGNTAKNPPEALRYALFSRSHKPNCRGTPASRQRWIAA
jgi:hypothetical protein